VVWLLDVIAAVNAGESATAGELAREPLWVPESLPVATLLAEMQAAGERFAVVLDEYGGTAGIVTVEDAVSELVGEIAEPGTAAGPSVARRGDGGWEVDGRLHLTDAAGLLGVELPSHGYYTVAGLVTDAAGAIPDVGGSVTVAGHEFTVLDASRLRIHRVGITPSAPDGD
jgi:putative hemolysin